MDYREVTERIKQETRTYLEQHGHNINERGYFRCPNPDHDDKNPSCHFVPQTNIMKCFSCVADGTLVRTTAGLKKIQDVKVGDTLTNLYGQPTKVVRTKRHRPTSALLNIYTAGGRAPITVTEDHGMFVVRDATCSKVYSKGPKLCTYCHYVKRKSCSESNQKFRSWKIDGKVEARTLNVGDALLFPIPKHQAVNKHKDKKDTYTLGIPKTTGRGREYATIDGVDYYLRLITKIELANDVDVHTQVNDITVDGHPSYCLEHVAVGNCGWSGDVFHLAQLFEGLPARGKEFITVTLPKLCEQFNIPFEVPKFTEQEEAYYSALKAYRDAANVMLGFGADFARIKERGWDQITCVRTLTGAVPGWDEFVKAMRALGYTKEYLKQIDINKRIFNEYTVIFTWCNAHGDPIGFAARDTRYVDGGDQPPRLAKYVNTGSISPTFDKSRELFGLQWAKNSRPLVIVEGFADVVTPYMHGIRNIVGLGGTALTSEHIALLERLNINNIILALDGDKPGTDHMAEYIDTLMAGHSGLNIKVLDLNGKIPGDIKPDPDNFFKSVENPKESWNALEAEPAFKWRINQLKNEGPDEVCKKALKLVINETKNYKREAMLQQISDITGIRLKAIQKDFDNLVYFEEKKIREKADILKQGVMSKLRNANTEEIINIIESSGREAENIKKNYNKNEFNPADTIEFVDELVSRISNDNAELRGWDTCYPQLNAAMSGMPKEGRIIGIVGKPSCGKSSFMHQLIWNMLNKNDDIVVLLFTIDDARQIVMPRFISIETFIPTRLVLSPKKLPEAAHARWKAAWDKLKGFISSGKLDIRDASQGSDLTYLENWVNLAREKNPDKKILVALDNFHKLRLQGAEERTKFKQASQDLQRLVETKSATVICSMELKKTYTYDPTEEDIAESSQLAYDADVLIYVHSYLKKNPDTTSYWVTPEGIKQPVVKMAFWKNKVEGRHETIYYNMDTRTSWFKERDCPPEDMEGPNAEIGNRYATVMQGLKM